jgi:serine/threonine protein kinase
LALEPGVYIDARNKGSFTRFMNHSCEPNCKTEKWTVKGETRIAVVAQRTIQEREELTFDYQWKSLGSMQIKCYCGSANCKGVIGSEVDTSKQVVDNGPRGFYRDPTKDEIGDALVGRHLRLFVSASDTSVYTIATVRSFNDEDQTYELEYGDRVGCTSQDILDSPLPTIDDLRNQPFVKLEDHAWQIFVELSGLSEDQIDEAVFAIPKRRPSGGPAVVGSDSPANGTIASPSQSSSTPSSTPGPAPTVVSQETSPSQQERRDQDGELLDADGDIVTTKLLIKGLPPKCDEALLRRLFMAPRNARSSSMLEKLQASVVSKRPSDAIVVQLSMFFFDDMSGWALIEFADTVYPKYFRKNLNARDLLGRPLRVFLAGRREVGSFERAKRNNAIRGEEKRGVSDSSSSNAAVVPAPTFEKAKPTSLPYAYGRALDWRVSIERVEDSPSRRKGTSAALEDKLRATYVKTITTVAKRLRLEREDASSAILALHRFYTFCPMRQNVDFMGAGMLHLYLKAHGRKIAWTEFVSEVYACKSSSSSSAPMDRKAPTTQLKPESDMFKRCERQILETEMELLEGLLFDLSSEDPYGLLELLTSPSSKQRRKSDGATDADNGSLVPADVQKETWALMPEVLRLPVWAHTSVECVVISILYIGAAVTGAVAYSGTNLPFSTCLTPEFLPWLDPVASERDALALLDCSLYIVDHLKERWVRLDRKAAAGRLQSDPSVFDTEQFAVQRHKPVEMTQRITMLIKAWIDAKSPPPSDNQASTLMARMTLDDLSRRRRTGSFHIVEDKAQKPPVKASDLLRLEPGVKGAQDHWQKPPRLHVCDIEHISEIRKRTFLGSVSPSMEGVEIAGKPVFLLPWPYREHEPVYSEQTGASRACARELSTALTMTSRAPKQFLGLEGIVFPDDARKDSLLSMDFDDAAGPKRATQQLRKAGHYCAFAQPLHLYSGLLDARADVPMPLRKRAIYDMVHAVALCHEWGYIHRYIAPCNLFVFRDGIRLGGYHAIRKLSLKKPKSDSDAVGRHEMSDSERKEHCHGSWLHVTPPEILLGERVFSTRGDVWSMGCVALMILFDRIPLLQGPDLKGQVNHIFRLCGTPSSEWPDAKKLSQYAALKPKHEYRMRLRKTLLEHCQTKNLAVPIEAIDVLEAMLQLDPSKRRSAKQLLAMEYFAEFRQPDQVEAADFSGLPPTFDAQRRKLEHQLKKAAAASSSSFSVSSSKRRRMHSDHEGRSDSAESDSKSRRHSSAPTSRRTSATNEENCDGNGDENAEFVPLPDHFHDTVMADATHGKGDHEDARMVTKKRAKLGWGMGLNS